MPKKKSGKKKAASKSKPRKKASAAKKYECDVCGATIVMSKGEVKCVEDMICCGQQMKPVSSRSG